MRIGKIARQAGVGVETIRFYEQKGLIVQPPKPLAGGLRDYPPQAVRRIRFIRSAQQLGFSLLEIAELLQLDSRGDAQCVEVRRHAQVKRDDVQNRIENLTRLRQVLDDLIDACPGKGPARQCSILGAINSGDLSLAPIKDGKTMADKIRKIEIFSAGCSICQDVVRQVKDAACPSCDVQVLDMGVADIQKRAEDLGIKSVPAVVIDGKLADCCASRGVDLDVLRSAGLGKQII